MADVLRLTTGMPCPLDVGALTGSFTTTTTLDANNDAHEVVFQVPEAVTITKLAVHQGTLTGTPPVFRVSLQGVDGSGNPDGTIKNSANAYFDWTPSAGDNNTVKWFTLGATYAAARGEHLALVVTYQSGTIDASNKVTIQSSHSGMGPGAFPYYIANNGGSRSRGGGVAVFGYGTASHQYGNPIAAFASANFQSDTTPDEIALHFSLPSGAGSSYAVLGARYVLRAASNTGQRMQLYSGTTVLQTITMPANTVAGAAAPRLVDLYFDEASLTALTPGSVYRLGLRPENSVSNDTFYYLGVTTASDLDAYEGGADWHWSERTDDGAWTDTTTRRPLIWLILGDVTASGGGGTRAYASVL